MEQVRRYCRVTGLVQGVGFRYYTRHSASQLGLSGWVHNCEDGSVELEVQGERETVDTFLDAVARGPRYAQVDHIEVRPLELLEWERSFEARDAWM